ncbi:hypothetical protein Tco_0546579 [Tanacetum coccineum]
MPEGVLVLSGLSRVWKSRTRDLILKDSNGNVIGIYNFLCLPKWTGSKVQEEPHHHTRPTLQRLPLLLPPPFEASKKHTFGATPSIIAKRIRSAMAQSFRETSRPNLFVGDDDNDDACVEIPLITPIYSTATIPTRGNKSEGSCFLLLLKVQHSEVLLFLPIVLCYFSYSLSYLLDFFPFTPGPYYATYSTNDVATGSYRVSQEEWDGPHQPTLTILTKKIFKDPSVCKTVVDQLLTSEEMVRIKALIDDQLAAKMSGLQEYAPLPAKDKGKDRKKKIKYLFKNLDRLTAEVTRLCSTLNQATFLEAERDAEILHLRASSLEFASFFQIRFQSLVQKFLTSDEFSRVQGKLISLAASTGFECGLSMDQTPKEFFVVLKKVSDYATHPMSAILQLEPEKLAGLEIIPP